MPVIFSGQYGRSDLSEKYSIYSLLSRYSMGIVHRFDLWSGRALPSPGEGNKVRGEVTGRARLEGEGHREGKA